MLHWYPPENEARRAVRLHFREDTNNPLQVRRALRVPPSLSFDRQCIAQQCHERGIVWATKYRLKVLEGQIRMRAREIIRQTCNELGVQILKVVLDRDHVHLFLEVPPKHAISDVMRRVKGRSSRRLQQEFPSLKKRYWGKRFWARGYFCTTSGNVTDQLVLQYLEQHTRDATDLSR